MKRKYYGVNRGGGEGEGVGGGWMILNEKNDKFFSLLVLLILLGFSPSWAGPDVGGVSGSVVGGINNNHLTPTRTSGGGGSNNNRIDNHHHTTSTITTTTSSSSNNNNNHRHHSNNEVNHVVHVQNSVSNLINKGSSSSSNSVLNGGGGKEGSGLIQLNLTFITNFERNCPNFCTEQTQSQQQQQAAQYNYDSICINRGCRQWKSGLQDGCSSACSGSEGNFREFYACQVGCSKAIEEYYNRITGMLGVLHAPTLSSDSLKSTSLQLSWEGSWPQLPYLVYTIQRKLFHRDRTSTTTTWETIPTAQPFNQTFFTVQGLKPYTDYQFRIGWILAHDFPPYYTAESNPIETLPAGLPNPPEITSIQPISNTSVSVTWIPPSQPNGKLVAYILKLHKLPNGHAIIKEIPMDRFRFPRGYTFSGLQPSTNYSLSISAQNLEGEGGAANINFVTPQSSMSNHNNNRNHHNNNNNNNNHGGGGGGGGGGNNNNDISKKPDPRLLLQGAKDVYIQQMDLLLKPDVTVFGPTAQNVTAITAHFKYKWVFIATEDGQIMRRSLERNGSLIIFPRGRLDIHPVSFMSVDWLHDQLYLVGREKGRGGGASWCVKRCGLGGEEAVTIYRGLVSQPIDFMADPFTGYLYWVSKPSGGRNFGALYRMDMLSDNVTPTSVIETDRGDELGPFTVDFVNYRILIVHKTKNTVLSVSLDGDVVDIRENTMSRQFENAMSIGMYQGLFYWTTGESVVVEEYNEEQKSFYQNSYDVPKAHQPCSRLLILHPDLQPVPVPMAPPRLPQVVMGTRQARVSWRPPAVIAGLGPGAWTKWKYEIRLSDNTSYENISDTEFVLKGLHPSASYTVQVLAYSPSGRGPLSVPFRGKTLRETAYNISLLWASQSGLYSTDALGENVHPLVTSTQWTTLGGHTGYSYIWSLAWHDEASVLFALSNGSVFHYQGPPTQEEEGRVDVMTTTAGRHLHHLKAISYAQSIAFDYIGQKVYWSNPKRQTILRCSITSCDLPSDQEWLRVVTMAKEIGVDSYRALLVWSTGHSLEVSHLNGYSHAVLYQTGLFSGVQIQGFTLDTVLSRVYWINRATTGSTLLWLNYDNAGFRTSQKSVVMATFPDISIPGPIRYFNERLLWLQGSNQSVLADVSGSIGPQQQQQQQQQQWTTSSLEVDTINNITSLHVRDQSSQRYPGGLDKKRIQVVPNPVNRWSIRVEGKSDNFTISWQPVNNTNYGGPVYYEIVINGTMSKVTFHSAVRIDNSGLTTTTGGGSGTSGTPPAFPPFSDIQISIMAISHWASAKPTIVTKQTPSAKPGGPQNPRVFLQEFSPVYRRGVLRQDLTLDNDNDRGVSIVNAELRWDPPAQPNGMILGYLIECWRNGVKKSDCGCDGGIQNVHRGSCDIQNLDINSTYQFAVQAYNNAGAGNVSRMVQAYPKFANPVPKLLIATSDKLQIFDIDQSPIRTISALGALSPISAVYFALEQSIYWINEGQDLMTAHLVSGNKTRILSLNGQGEGSHLAVDWIGRKLFWAMEFPSRQFNGNGHDPEKTGREPRFAIMALDLSAMSEGQVNRTPSVIMTSHTPIKGITVNPFRSMILWTTSKNNGINTLYASRTDGSSPSQFLSRDRINCNCSNCSSVGEAISFDASGFHDLRHGILFTNDQSIWLSDERGCDCLQMVNMTFHASSRPRLAPYKLAGSGQHVFWAAGYLHASEKPGNGVTELLTSDVREISIMGPSAQPFPDLNCLIPRRLVPAQPVQFNQFSSYSLHLHLPVGRLEDCGLSSEISMAALHYQVYYGSVDDKGLLECTPSSLTSCRVIETTAPILHLTNLFPFTTYTVFLTATNIYGQLWGVEPLTSPAIMFSTAAGAPMPPKLLRLEPLTPSTVRVVWRQPDKLNGERVWYKVYWQPEKKKIVPGPGWAEVEASSDEKWSELELQSRKNRTEFHIVVKNLQPSCNYSVWVVAFSEKGDAFSSSDNLTVLTYPSPGNITLQKATPHSLTIQWVSPQDPIILRHQISYRIGWSSMGWNLTEPLENTVANLAYNYTIQNLKPNTMYGFKIKTWYVSDPDSPYEWPPQNGSGGNLVQFSLETMADKPGLPGQPIARGIGKALYEVSWEKAEGNGATVQIYSLECRTESNSPVFETLSHHSEGHGHSSGQQGQQGQGHSQTVDSTTLNSIGGGVLPGRRRKREWTTDHFEHFGHQGGGGGGGGGGKPEMAQKLVATEKGGHGHGHGHGGWTAVSNWVVVYNGTETRWEVKNLDMDALYFFRVRALNYYGWGLYSSESSLVSLASLTVIADPQPVGVIMGTISLAIIALAIIGSIFIYVYRQKLKEKPSLHGPNSSVELATLRELPGGSSFIHQSNILYAASDLVLDLELTGVPQVTRHQISLTKFLGSGAFGEVYEGIALNLPRTDGEDNRVAIKTLRKGASNNEKIEFIQEAKLMTQFRHPHILQLLGICIETDPCCLLLELMDGGDLLSYLRSNRPHLGSVVVLSMIDLLKMCVDVAKGCVYLEEMHFVHRDLAARNCLVRILERIILQNSGQDEQPATDPSTSPQPANVRGGNGGGSGGRSSSRQSRGQDRVVKIGDFGLARDVYRNDYYRKEGEGLLPVRWMAPESLIDGIYTTQSDVWAFGVLLWEIMTLGQQPYPARNNLEVLHYVRAGGRLQQPSHCPERLSELMIQCWEFNADNRPSFKTCLSQLELILRDFEGSHGDNDNANYPTIQPTDSQLQQYNNYLQPGSDTKLSYLYGGGNNNEENDEDHHHHHHHHHQQQRGRFSPSFLQTQNSEFPTGTPHAHGLNPDSPGVYNGESGGSRVSSSYPKYLEVLCDSRSDDDDYPLQNSMPPLTTVNTNGRHHRHHPFTSLPPFGGVGVGGTTDEGYEIPLPRKPPRNPKNAQIVNRLASKVLLSGSRNCAAVAPAAATADDGTDIGLPSPPPSYWNCGGGGIPIAVAGAAATTTTTTTTATATLASASAEIFPLSGTTPKSSSSVATGSSFPFSSSSISESDSLNNEDGGIRILDRSSVRTNQRSKCYVNARRLGMFDEDSPSHFRNLLASTTSTDDDLEMTIHDDDEDDEDDDDVDGLDGSEFGGGVFQDLKLELNGPTTTTTRIDNGVINGVIFASSSSPPDHDDEDDGPQIQDKHDNNRPTNKRLVNGGGSSRPTMVNGTAVLYSTMTSNNNVGNINNISSNNFNYDNGGINDNAHLHTNNCNGYLGNHHGFFLDYQLTGISAAAAAAAAAAASGIGGLGGRRRGGVVVGGGSHNYDYDYNDTRLHGTVNSG